MSNKNKQNFSTYNNDVEDYDAYKPRTSRAKKIAVALGASTATTIAVLVGGNMVSHAVEPDIAAASSTETNQQPHFEYINNDLSHDVQDQLVSIQSAYMGKPDRSPVQSTNPDMNEIGEDPVDIVDGEGGLIEQSIKAAKAAKGLSDGQELPDSAQQSIAATVAYLAQLDGIHNVSSGQSFTILDQRDLSGTEYMIVAPTHEDKN